MKRTPMPRGKPLVRTKPDTARLTIKLKKCKHCRIKFVPASAWQAYCRAEDCAVAAGAEQTAKRQRAEAKAKRQQNKLDAAALEALKGLPKLKAEAQAAFNRYVRYRDHGKGCFVCGDLLTLGGVGGGFDAGHIRSRSQADHLRYDERNVFGQCKPCNAAGSTKDHVMRAAAARLLGEAEAEELYADNCVAKWTRDGVRAIRDEYQAKALALKKLRGL